VKAQALILAAALALPGCGGGEPSGAADDPAARPPAPVEVARAEVRSITRRRTISGTLEASAEVLVAPRVPGQVERLLVDIGDTVEDGEVVARLDDDEWRQAVARAEADLSVAEANDAEAEAANEIAQDALARAKALYDDGVTSQGEYDQARTRALERSSRTAVTGAEVERARAALDTAQLRLSRAEVMARWNQAAPARVGSDGDGPQGASERLVAERFVDDGAFVDAGQPLVRVVDLTPVIAVVFVAERDFSGLAIGQAADLTTDAYPGETFAGRVVRIAPVFSSSTRQVRVELAVENPELRLRPGMFVRTTLELEAREDATVVPYAALLKRDGGTGVFVLSADGQAAVWRPVTAGIRDGGDLEVVGEGVAGARVVTLGQELLDDGSPVRVTEGPAADPAAVTR